MTDRQEKGSSLIFYPIISHKKTKNKFFKPNENNNINSLKNKTEYNMEMQNNKQNISKSLKIIRPENKYFKMQKLMNKKLRNFVIDKKKSVKFNKTNISLNKKGKKEEIFNKNISNNTIEMKDLLNKLIKLKQKINEINDIKKKKINNLNTQKNGDYLKSVWNKNKNKSYKLKHRNNKINNLDNIFTNKSENRTNNYKTQINFNNSIKNNKKYVLSLDRENNFKKENKENNKRKSYTYNIVTEHTNYIDKIRNNEFINILKKFKKSLKKNKKEEIYHKKSLVFPSELVNYIIKEKKELIIDKYRNEYLNKIDTYKYNTQKILKAIKYHNFNDNNESEKKVKFNDYDNNLNKSNIKKKLAQEINDINGIKVNNVSNHYIDYINDKLELLNN